ncbi:unnamed protein product [Cuscuta epithymum]|uniref:1-phosphatidylinositol-3-phosphate 5-kinase n=1 Tax=Cuscuta epithymum TaxID=186058 RepID=A0AAV0CXP1_9ASTE|nr:unnamed protein product [Cuscuta epithymum]
MEKQESEKSKRLNDINSVQSYRSHGETTHRKYVDPENSTSQGVESISPTVSLQISERSISSCSDFSVDVNSECRGYVDESSTDSSQECLSTNVNGGLHDFSLRPSNGINVDSNPNPNSNKSSEVEHSRVESDTDEETGKSLNVEMEADFWLPPDPGDRDLDMEGSVANFEDDDDDIEYADGLNLVSFGEEDSGSIKFKEEKRKAMEVVMRGKFKALVAQLLRSVGIKPTEEGCDSWIDVVSCLSWNAASFVKLAAAGGKAMDPDSHVKVKCVATGTLNQSQFVKGLVFKKHAAHKHMPTRFKSPRLLLIRGALGLSSNELSSFESMQQQEKDGLKSFEEMLEKCHPNIVLVEKAVSRDVQESILKKGMTLVFDMKLHRLERVARCTGSPILSCDSFTAQTQKLKHCDSFHFEKFTEEHTTSREGGRKPNKTLMFIEGCSTRLGCSILLMGSNSDELKRIKCVVRCAVVMAYHLILETSFLLDQRAMFSTISPTHLVTVSANKQKSISTGDGTESFSNSEDSLSRIHSTVDIVISNGFDADGDENLQSEVEPALSLEAYTPIILSGFPSLREVMGESFPILSSSRQSTPSHLGFTSIMDDQVQPEVQFSNPSAVVYGVKEPKIFPDEEKDFDNENIIISSKSLEEDLDPQNNLYEDQKNGRDDISTLLDSESILVLMSSRNASKGIMCEHSHFSHIRFYKDFDAPLGNFLLDNLLSQKLLCKTCGEPPEVHIFYYAHHDKQLKIQVRRCPADGGLSGSSEGKLWMWSRCGKCKQGNGNLKSTKRVLISAAARGLSFGRFLELTFSNSSFLSEPSNCGHSLHRDFVLFFGMGQMVAMFRYSTVATYSVSVPPLQLEFNSPIKGEFMNKDVKNVYSKGIRMFKDIENTLKDMWSHSLSTHFNLGETPKEFIEIEAMLKVERSQFEVDIDHINNGNVDNFAYKLLSLNRIRLELLLESWIWDRRLHALLSSGINMVKHRYSRVDNMGHGKTFLTQDEKVEKKVNHFKTDLEKGNTILDNVNNAGIRTELEDGSDGDEMDAVEVIIEGPVDDNASRNTSPLDLDVTDIHIEEENHLDEQVEGSLTQDDSSSSSSPSVILEGKEGNKGPIVQPDMATCDAGSIWAGEEWIWAPFPEIQSEFMKDLKKGNLPKVEFVTSHAAESVASGLIADEALKLHIPLGDNDEYIVCDFEDELSSIIACALALMKDSLPKLVHDLGDGDRRKDRVMDANIGQHWSSGESLESERRSHSSNAILDEESSSSSFDRLDSLDPLILSKVYHSEVNMGSEKHQGKRKYSVTCTFARQFRQLRDRCCTSEDDYIASISRCKAWEAKGGKSKSFFAKTLDDRFIIKGIKRTEYDSFMVFGPEYFQYMDQCFEMGNQTCLAKILGVYQVTIRQTKNGKETKHELMVMENLSFGRNITRQYDLKGALHARFNTASDGGRDVLLDQNFVNDMNASPLYVSRKSKRNLQRAVWNDCGFLNMINVMDYSLLVGVDMERRELVCGIIDYLRQYTWDKQLENLVKSSLVVPKNQLPTVISPKEYKKRFRKFIDTHFLSVPDHWCSQRSSKPCQLCGTAGRGVDSAPRNSQNLGGDE